MAKRSTRSLIIASRDRLEGHINGIDQELKRMMDLGDNNSPIINQAVFLALRANEVYKDSIMALFKGL